MADRGNRGQGRGQGRFQQQPLPNRGGGNRGGGQHGDRGRGNYGNQGAGPARGQFQGGGRGGGGRGRGQDARRIFKQDGKVHGSSSTVTKLEDDTIQQSLVANIQQLSLKDPTGMPKRPAYGTKGRQIFLWTNYFELQPSRESTFNRYDVSMLDDKNESPKGKKLERCMQFLQKQLPDTVPIASDWRKTLITPKQLPFTQREFLIHYYSESEQGPGPKSPKYKAKVQFTGTFTFADLLDYLSSADLTRGSVSTKEEILQAANIIIASGMKSNSKIITKSNKYFPTDDNLIEKWTLATGLNAFRGLFMSVRAATGRILLNVQVQHVATWEEQPMLNLLGSLLHTDKESLSDVHHMIKGVMVKVAHLGDRLKRVAGFVLQGDGRGSPMPPKIMQSYANATQVRFYKDQQPEPRWVTVAEYFAETYRALQQPNAPLLNIGSRSNPVYMPAELCNIKELQTYDKKLSPKATEKMISFAVRHPADNAQTIAKNGTELLRANSKSNLDAFGVGFNPSMIVVSGRVLVAATIEYQNKKTLRPQDASWNMMNTRFNLGAKIPSWTYLWIRTETTFRDRNGNQTKSWKGGDFNDKAQVDTVVDDFYNTLLNCGAKVDLRLPPYALNLTNINDPGQEVDNKFAEIAKTNVEVLLVILPKKSTTIYNAVKRAGDIKYGIHTIDVVADRKKFCQRFFRDQKGQGIPNVQFHANVALKFNLKLGGRNQVLVDADRGFIREGKTMLVGLDVTHPAPGSASTAPSVSSITASIDSHLSQWPADVAIQTRSKELIEGLKGMFKSRLALWQKHQSKYPEEIIVYRDGVGDSMYELVLTKELPLIREACSELYSPADTKAGKPYITIIICGKRHHTRFYPTDVDELDKNTGCTKSGTIVDRGITETRVWDFYLQAHTALHGTPRSAHYVVIHDEVFLRRAAMQKVNDKSTAAQRAADEVQRLTHAMCYTFGRATKAVSLCPPAYYADIACERARLWLSGVFDERSLASSQAEVRSEDVQVHPRLRNSMYYM